jgi:hypothetical protein
MTEAVIAGPIPAYRIQLRRIKGWRKPADAVVITRSGPWGNPFTVASALEHEFAATAEEARLVCSTRFGIWLRREERGDQDVYRVGARSFDRRWMWAHLPDLAGHRLACACSIDGPCHGDELHSTLTQWRRT